MVDMMSPRKQIQCSCTWRIDTSVSGHPDERREIHNLVIPARSPSLDHISYLRRISSHHR
jgi:hypothetical protein